MPLATPETYAAMLDRAKEGGFAYPAINITSSITINAALRGFAEAGSDGIIQASTGGAEFASGHQGQGHGDRRGRAGRVHQGRRRQVRHHRRAAHRSLPEGQARHLRQAADRDLDRAGQGRRPAAVPVAHVGRLGGAAGREPEDRPGAAGADQGGEHHPRDRGRRGRRRGGRRRRARSTRSCTPRRTDFIATLDALGLPEDNSYIVAATFGNVHGVYKPGGVTLRPKVLKDGQDALVDEARSRRPVRSRSRWCSTAGPVRRRRRSPRRCPTA